MIGEIKQMETIMYHGKNVYLSAYKKDDLQNVVDLINDWEIQRTLFPGLISPFCLEDEIEWYERNRQNKERGHSFAIRTTKDNIYIGGAGYHDVNFKNRTCYVGISIMQKDYQNKGLGTEAFELLINYLFNEMNIRKILLNVFSTNKRAIHVYEKLGFSVEGVLKDHIYRNGLYDDEIIMAKFSK